METCQQIQAAWERLCDEVIIIPARSAGCKALKGEHCDHLFDFLQLTEDQINGLTFQPDTPEGEQPQPPRDFYVGDKRRLVLFSAYAKKLRTERGGFLMADK